MMQTGGHTRPLAMRDTDAVFSTVFVARPGSGIVGAAGIASRRLALGSADSAHAAILPLYYLTRAGVDLNKLQVARFNSDIGKHGDTGTSELDAIDAVLAGKADVAAIGITIRHNIDQGELFPGGLDLVWPTETYSHCMFTALDSLPKERYAPWVAKLLAWIGRSPPTVAFSSWRDCESGSRHRWPATPVFSRRLTSRASTDSGNSHAFTIFGLGTIGVVAADREHKQKTQLNN